MAMGGGIVASDLEQIGEVLRPRCAPADFAEGAGLSWRSNARSCAGPEMSTSSWQACWRSCEIPRFPLRSGGTREPRRKPEFSWERHVERIWKHALGLGQGLSWREAS